MEGARRCRPGKGLTMSRAVVVPLLLCLTLACGCNRNKKDPNAPDTSANKTSRNKQSKSDQKLEQAQRDNRQKPDRFESSDDPPLTADTHFAAGQLNEYQGN